MIEEKINSIAFRLIEDNVSELYDFSDDKNDNIRLATLGEIRGIILLAIELKKELKNA